MMPKAMVSDREQIEEKSNVYAGDIRGQGQAFGRRADPVTFGQRLVAAVHDGVVWGVKISLVFGLIVIAVSYLLGDYGATRQRALNGQRAFEFIQQTIAQQQGQARPAPSSPALVPAPPGSVKP